MTYKIRLAKDTFKFSATHFTLFSASRAERLHGHNYQVAVEIDVADLDGRGMTFEFGPLKAKIKHLTEAWDERVLLPGRSPWLRFESVDDRAAAHTAVRFNDRYYCFPNSDLLRLDADNITAEELARLFTSQLLEQWLMQLDRTEQERVLAVTTLIEETRGQSASCTVAAPFAEKPR